MDKNKQHISHYSANTYFDTSLPAKVIFHKQYLSIWHDHNFYELALVISGKGVHKTLERKTAVQNGFLLFLKPGDIHSYQVDNGSLSIINVLIQPAFFDNTLLADLLENITKTECMAQIMPGTWNYERLLDNLQLLKKEENSKKAFHKEMFASLLFESLSISARSFMAYKTNKKTRKYGELIAGYISEHSDREPCLEDLSELTGLSSSYIGRSFKDITGYKFVELVNEYRIKKACDLLIHSDVDIDEIYNQSGYKNKVYFHRAFKRVTGFSPLQYRKLLNKTEVVASN